MASNPLFRSSRSERQIPLEKCGKARVKAGLAKRSVASSLRTSIDDEESESGRVRAAVRLRPKVAADLPFDSDFTDCVELQPELKRLKLKRNNWSSVCYKFDEVFTESASQKRVYDIVARPVVESVLNGYNGTVMAYGQTGTGKTYTVGQLGKEDPSERGIMVRSLADILASISPDDDAVAVSYFQLYLDSVQDLLAPEKVNIPIVEDPKTGEISLPGALIVEIRTVGQFFELLQVGEANRHAANTKLNTESSRSHAILMVHIQRLSKVKEEKEGASLTNNRNDDLYPHDVPLVLKSKLLIVDLAGSERIDKSGSEGLMLEEAKFINLSLTSLGKCINELAENSPHISTRDSKLTRLLRDSFGGTARTSLILTIGPSSQHYSETASTILFGQRAMKIVNMVKLKEEFDYESHCRKLEYQLDCLTAEMERQQKLRDHEKEQLEKKMKDQETILAEAEKRDAANCEHHIDNSKYQKVLAETTQMYEEKMRELTKQVEMEHSYSASLGEELATTLQSLSDSKTSLQAQEKEIDMLHVRLKLMLSLNKETTGEIQSLKADNNKLLLEKKSLEDKLKAAQDKLLDAERQRKCLGQKFMTDNKISQEACDLSKIDNPNRLISGLGGDLTSLAKPSESKEIIHGQKATISKIFKEVGLSYTLPLLKSEDLDVQIHAVKVIANLAAEDLNQEKIVEEGGLDALLRLLKSSEDLTIYRVTAGAIANLAMNGLNQGLIMSKGGARLLANIAYRTDDPQTLRMVAGAIANLCGNENLHVMLKEDGGTKALLQMARSGHPDVIAQIARGLANFAKCESRGVSQGRIKGRSLLIEDGALSWIAANSTAFSASTRHHIELALCHLAQNEGNELDLISSGGIIRELVRISQESSREDIKNLAKKVLGSNPQFVREMQTKK